jgi:hypothetical protein
LRLYKASHTANASLTNHSLGFITTSHLQTLKIALL